MARSFEIGLSYLDQLPAGAMMAQACHNSMLQRLFHKTYNQICEDLKFTKRQPRTLVPHATKSPDIGMCRTASRTMRTEGHCRPRACKTWTCTISNTMVIKEPISFSFYFFNLYCIAYCTRPRFTSPGAKPGTRGWTAGRAPGRPQQAAKPTRHGHEQHHLTASS